MSVEKILFFVAGLFEGDEKLQAKWNLPNADSINCFAVWVESRLTKGISFSTRQTTSWLPQIYRIEPIEGNFNLLEFNLSLNKASNYWTSTFSNAHHKTTRNYSPEFAATELTLYSRTADADLIKHPFLSEKIVYFALGNSCFQTL